MDSEIDLDAVMFHHRLVPGDCSKTPLNSKRMHSFKALPTNLRLGNILSRVSRILHISRIPDSANCLRPSWTNTQRTFTSKFLLEVTKPPSTSSRILYLESTMKFFQLLTLAAVNNLTTTISRPRFWGVNWLAIVSWELSLGTLKRSRMRWDKRISTPSLSPLQWTKVWHWRFAVLITR